MIFGRVSWYHGSDVIKQRQKIINTFLANEGYRALGTHANFGIVVSQFTIGCTLSVGEVEQALCVADEASSGRGGSRIVVFASAVVVAVFTVVPVVVSAVAHVMYLAVVVSVVVWG